MIVSLCAILALLFLSAMTSGTETAMTAASRARIHSMAQEGNGRARSVRSLLDQRERLLGSLLLGNNAFNILAASIATDFLIKLTGQAGVAYASLGMTLLVVIFAEILPKTYAIRHPEQMAMVLAPAVRVLVFVATPFTRAVSGLVNGILRLFGAPTSSSLTPGVDLLRDAIEYHREEGEIAKQDKDMLGGILDLADVEVDAVMTHRSDMATIDAASPIDDVIGVVETNPYTRYPVWEDKSDHIIGILHARDLLVAVKQASDSAAVELKTLLSEPWFVPDTTSLKGQLFAFRQRRSHLALVVDEYGSLMGLVTLEDIIEEIVGDIVDEKDVEVSGVQLQTDGSLLVDGKVTLRDLNRQFDWKLPDDEAATIAGLVIHEAQRIPEMGQSFTFHGFRFDILRRHRHQITRLRVVPPPAEP